VRVEVRFLATFRKITGESSIKLLCAPGQTVGILMQKLIGIYGKRFEQAAMEGANLNPVLKIVINGRDIDFLNGLDTELKDEDVIVIIPPVAGG
jgi:molybdopterin synthase sulfur carrier subunit